MKLNEHKLTLSFENEMELELFKADMTKKELARKNMIFISEHFARYRIMTRRKLWKILKESNEELKKELYSDKTEEAKK